MCEAHKIKAVVTLKSTQDDSEHDLCPECFEAFNLIVSGALFADAAAEGELYSPTGDMKDMRRRGRIPKAKEATA